MSPPRWSGDRSQVWRLLPVTTTDLLCVLPADSALPRLGNVGAAESFIDSSEVVVVGFFEVRGDIGRRGGVERQPYVDLGWGWQGVAVVISTATRHLGTTY